MKSANPIVNPLFTSSVWLPKYVPSEITSLNHNDIEYTNVINANNNTYFILWKRCIDKTPAVVKVNKLIELNIGQGEGDTK